MSITHGEKRVKKGENMKIKVRLTDEHKDILRGVFVDFDDFDEVFENVDDIYKFFDEEIIICAFIVGDVVYFVSTDNKYLTLWKAEIVK